MDLIIERKNGEKYISSEHNMKIRSFSVSSPVPTHIHESFENRDGYEDLGTYYTHRTINAVIKWKGVDNTDTLLSQNKIFQIFDSREEFYLMDSRQFGKRFIVKCENSFTPEQRNAYSGEIQITFKAKPYAESVGTTLDPFTTDSGLWGIGMGLSEGMPDYSYNTTSFSVENAGDKEIDPRHDWLVITFKGDSTNLKITNTTNGDEWSYTGTSNAGDIIKIDGIRSTKNALSIVRNTNRKLIRLEKGINNITVSGASSFTIDFEFRFKYV